MLQVAGICCRSICSVGEFVFNLGQFVSINLGQFVFYVGQFVSTWVSVFSALVNLFSILVSLLQPRSICLNLQLSICFNPSLFDITVRLIWI